MDKLNKLITDTMVWLVTHQTEPADIYQNKINGINDICNAIHHSMHKMKVLENLDIVNDDMSDSEEEEAPEIISPEANPKNKINENIKDLLDKLPDKLINNHMKKKPKEKSDPEEAETDLMLKIDLSKLNSSAVLRYKNVVMPYR
jgi:hypothetical protein